MARWNVLYICLAAVVAAVVFFSSEKSIDFGATTLPSIKYAVIKADVLLELPGECGFNAAGLDLSSSSSDDNFEGKMTDIPGVCSFIVPTTGDRTGCCFKDRALRFEPPDLHKDVYRLGVTGTTSCSSDCLTRYISFWCFFSCSGFNVTEDAICSEPITKLYQACAVGTGRCNILRSEGIAGIEAWRQAKQLTFAPPQNTDCADFGSWGYRCIETGVPEVVSAVINDNGAGNIADNTITIQSSSFTDFKKINYKFVVKNKIPFVAPGAAACSKNLFPTKGELTLEKDSVNLGTIKFDSFKFTRVPATDDQFQVISPQLIVSWVNGPGEYRFKFKVWNTFGASEEKSGSFHVVVSGINAATVFPDIFICDEVEGAKKGLVSGDGVFTGMPAWTPFLLPWADSTECPAPYISTGCTVSTPDLCCELWPRATPALKGKVNAGRVICCDEDEDYDTIGRRCHIQADVNNVWIKPKVLDTDEHPKFRTRITSTKLQIREDMPINGLVQLISSEILFDEDTPTFLRVPNADSNVKHAATIEGDAGSLISLQKNGKLIAVAKLFFNGDVRLEAGANSLIAATQNGRIVFYDNSSLAANSEDPVGPAVIKLQGGQTLLDTETSDIVLFTIESQARAFCSLELEGNVKVERAFDSYGDTTYGNAVEALVKPRILIVRGKACIFRDPTVSTSVPAPSVDASIQIDRDNEAAAQLDDMVKPENEWTEEVDALHKKGARQAVIDTALQCCGAQCGNDIDVQNGGAIIIGSDDAAVDCAITDPTTPPYDCSAYATGDVTVGPKGTLIFENVDTNTKAFCANSFTFNCAAGACPTVQIVLGENIGPDEVPINLLTTTSSDLTCDLGANLPRVLVTNQQTGRQVTLHWVAGENGACVLQAVVPKAPPPQAPQNSAALFLSNYEYCVYMALPATELTADEFKDAVEKHLGISRDRLQPFAFYGSDSKHNNDLLARFKCNDLSASSTADATCRVITDAALDEGSAFQLAVKATGTCENLPERTDEGSRTALFGLFGLMAIPILCILAICLLLKRHKRNADNQYMQDTATFSNVAAAPQAIAYTIPQGYKEPVVAYSAPAGFVEPPPPYY